MCGSPKAPPPPPDYSTQKSAFQKQQQSAYDKQASQYNAAATAFNNNIADFGSKVNQGLADYGNLNITSPDKLDDAYNFWSNLKTEASNPWTFQYSPTTTPTTSTTNTSFGDTSGWDSWQGKMALATGALLGADTFPTTTQTSSQQQTSPTSYDFSGLLGFNLAAPTFQSVVTTPYGGETVSLNAPSLLSPDITTGQNYLNQVNQALANIGNLRTQRQEELDRVKNYQTTYQTGLADLESRLAGLTAADLAGINTLQGDLSRLETQRRGFTSSLLPEFGDYFGYNSTEQDFQDVASGLADLRTQRNTALDSANATKLTNMGLFSNVLNQLSGLNIGDYDQIKSLDDQIDAAALGMQTYDGEVPFDFSGAMAAYNNVNSKIDALYNKRAAEEQRISNFESSLLQRANALEADAFGLGIGDASAFDALDFRAKKLRDEAAAFQSQMGFDLSQELNPLDAMAQMLADKRGQRQTELDRIDAFKGDLAGQLAALKDQAGGLTIADLDGIKGLDTALSNLDRTSRGFSSDLQFDFGDLFDEYSSLDSQIAQLYSDRAAEEARVNAAQNSSLGSANALLNSANLANIYDRGSLEQMLTSINDAQASNAGFASLLSSDFSGANDVLGQAKTQIEQLLADRAEALGGFDASGFADTISNADLWDTGTIGDARNDITQRLNELSMFTGNDVNSVRQAFSDALGLADDRTSELNTYRTGIEKQAKDMLTNLKGTTFFGDEDLNAQIEALKALELESNQYGASQASDELSSLWGRVEDEQGRIATDRATLADVNAADAQAGYEQIASNNMERFFNNLRYSPIQNVDYRELLQLLNSGGVQSAFSRSLGL